MNPKRPSESAVTFARTMTQLDANMLGNVHGGVIMREVDSAAGTTALRHAVRPCVTAGRSPASAAAGFSSFRLAPQIN